MLLKQYRGVTIEKRRAAQRTSTQSALLCGGVSGNFEEGGGRKLLNRKLPNDTLFDSAKHNRENL